MVVVAVADSIVSWGVDLATAAERPRLVESAVLSHH